MEKTDSSELLARFNVIEQMIAEGRRTTQHWGWVFLLWGFGPILAILWESRWAGRALAWPVVMAICVVINGVVSRRRARRGEARTIAARSLSAIWSSAAATLLVLDVGAACCGVSDVRFLYVAVFALTGAAHSASSIVSRWLPQFLVAILWWAAALAAFAVSPAKIATLAISILLLGNIGFGAWLTYREVKGLDG